MEGLPSWKRIGRGNSAGLTRTVDLLPLSYAYSFREKCLLILVWEKAPGSTSSDRDSF